MLLKSLSVSLDDRSYRILVGNELISKLGDYASEIVRRKKILIVEDEAICAPHGDSVDSALKGAGYEVSRIAIPSGETSKSVEQLMRIWDALAEGRFTRDTALIALGGGVLGDLAGFAAATYLRGIPYIQIPTSLLAMVDSSVGGKTAINHKTGKNLIGSFWQPALVLIDLDVLKTIPKAEGVSALAEVVKYGVIADWDFFEWLEAHVDQLIALESEPLARAIALSAEIKAHVVAEDEKESSGRREILNFGHTVGHAIENCAGYGALRHGEAIAIGMVVESKLASELSSGWTAEDHNRLVALLRKAGLPAAIPKGISLTVKELLLAAKSDKKNRDGQTRYALPVAPARMHTVSVDDTKVAPLLRAVGAH